MKDNYQDQTEEQDREGSPVMCKTISNPAFQTSDITSFGARGKDNGRPGDQAPTKHSTAEPLGIRRSPLAQLVSSYLRTNGLRQIDFCRQVGFDQGLLSKILSSVVSTLNVETALKLAEGMNLPPRAVFEAIGKSDVHEMLIRVYSDAAHDRAM